MDPAACLQRLMDALEMNEREEAAYAAADLQRWLDNGGAMPHIGPHDLAFLVGTLDDLLREKR